VDLWARRVSALVVAGVAAYASYEHQRRFALAGGADPTGGRLWPLSVDGLVLLATVGLLRVDHRVGRRGRWSLWAAFGFGIAVSLAANIAAAPALSWQPILVAGWPPIALLLAVELLAHHPSTASGAETIETPPAKTQPTLAPTETAETSEQAEAATPSQPMTALAQSANGAGRRQGQKAEEIMWEYFQRERAAGRTPSGAELDRAAATNNYGRAVLARWRREGRLGQLAERLHPLRQEPGGSRRSNDVAVS
jgi:hypothetical protein